MTQDPQTEIERLRAALDDATASLLASQQRLVYAAPIMFGAAITIGLLLGLHWPGAKARYLDEVTGELRRRDAMERKVAEFCADVQREAP